MSGLAVSGGVVVDDDPKVEHAFVGFFSQARTVEKDAQDGGAVGRGDLVREPSDAVANGLTQLCGYARAQSSEVLVGDAVLGAGSARG